MKISVIIPAYNCERFIARAIESVKRQTFADLECIVIDDCSTDGTYYVALEAMGDDLRFSAYSLLDNIGIARARNRGISFSKSSDALFFLDADDWLDRNCLEMLIARITGFKQVSVCEDVYGHWLYWKKNLNANPDDCCNLRVAYKENPILKRK